MPRSGLLAAAGLVASIALLGAAEARADADVYKSRYRTAEELLPIAEAALGGEGKVVVDAGTNSLVMLGPAPVLARARAILEQTDTKLHSVLIRYEERRAADLDEAGVAVRWSTDLGPVRIGNVVPRDGGSGAVVGAASAKSDVRGERSGTLRVLEGHSGRIETGTRIPYETGLGRSRSTAFVDATSGFEVRPRVLGDGRVRLALRPFGAQPAADGTIAYSGADTVLEVRPGETVAVGGVGGSIDMRRQGSRGAGTRRGSDERVLLITVRTD